MEKLNLRVAPQLSAVVQAAREAGIVITGLNFVRDEAHACSEDLHSIAMNVEGKDHDLAYFHYLLERQQLRPAC